MARPKKDANPEMGTVEKKREEHKRETRSSRRKTRADQIAEGEQILQEQVAERDENLKAPNCPWVLFKAFRNVSIKMDKVSVKRRVAEKKYIRCEYESLFTRDRLDNLIFEKGWEILDFGTGQQSKVLPQNKLYNELRKYLTERMNPARPEPELVAGSLESKVKAA